MNKIKHILWTTLITIHLNSDLFAMASRPNADPNSPPPPAWVSFAPMLFMIVVFYFLLIRPQSKQRQQRQNLIGNLKKGDKIITQGGFHAFVVNVGGDTVDVKLNEETKVTIQKSAVAEVINPTPQSPQSDQNLVSVVK